MKYFVPFVLIFIVAGCITPPKPMTSVTLSLELEDSKILVKEKAKKGVIGIELGVIPSAIYGAPLEKPFLVIGLTPNSGSLWNISDSEFNISTYAKAHNPKLRNNNLLVTPAETKMVRISTFGIDTEANTYMSGGLKDHLGNYQLLVYFDRACTISGELSFAGQGIFNHDIKIPMKGLYRLKIESFKGKNIVTTYKQVKKSYMFRNKMFNKSLKMTKNSWSYFVPQRL